MLLFIAFVVSFGVIAFIAVGYRSLNGLAGAVPEEDRLFLDPLPKSLRPLWPLVNFVVHHFGNSFSAKLVEKTDLQLRLTSLTFLMNARQFIALSIIASVLASLVVLVLMLALGMFSVLVLILVAALGYIYPRIWTRDVRRRRVGQILRHLPIYLDFLTLAVEAGLNINGAIQKSVEKGPEGPLRRELEHVLRDLKSGLNRTEALRRLDDRLRIKEVTNLVGTVVQAERMGSGLAKSLRFQSEQRRSERFQRAEKQAMEAPVKLVFPLLMFIFPITFIVLGFPIVMKFVQEGLL
ncbi:Flp pilus assembly protein TadC [Burkholderia sp. Ch1-1]|uniref:Type II/IV secretion system protein TadC, associated with Flp pilus assembly n=1 Tax=Paraburkholderia dioscoreae TaxID=2604047 RepID=A0A5Q4ZF58_9BURK|nr:type II secretion system F family protein [Paraburkholderia dioscoreae]EIF35535.1 Flp pilus assembly protein TadC [Burkholderia sp. Ch1-1]VVD31433.1 Type II/IV secretion system protein TadC, associated with Flp pilus assembly [Paraburkholderia dioscoreae]